MSLIKVAGLSKVYKRVIKKPGLVSAVQSLFYRRYEYINAVSDLSFSLEKGEMVGYIGPNGAGKSTTIKMLIGILVPTSGRVLVNGLIPHKERKKNNRRIGVVFGHRTQLWWDIPVIESLTLLRYIFRIPEKIFQENMEIFSQVLNINEFLHVPVRQLSLGQRMRADFCAALLHDPDILYLDEPTIGLDVVVKEKIRGFIRYINEQKKTTVILTTHDMQDIEKICKRVILIDQGRILYDGLLDVLLYTYANEEIINIKIEGAANLCGLDPKRVLDLKQNEKGLEIKYNPKLISSYQILKALGSTNEILDFIIKKHDLESIIKKIYSKEVDFKRIS